MSNQDLNYRNDLLVHLTDLILIV